ncbi:MAG: imidazole glycerol phosphate synthase subunit HisH [uncultured bacterium]|nr:MAG: imidazole glycerol phosphate synthase subunit HisH [uncultured bacterium]
MIAIIPCGANIASVQFALDRLGKKSIVTQDAKIIQSASHVILPGVGSAKQAMQKLQLLELIDVIRNLKQPVLGICLGMQILYHYSQEGDISCLGLLSGNITLLEKKLALTIPHMGWNQLEFKLANSSLLKNIKNKSYVYFVHSYAAAINSNTIATTNYGALFSAIVQNKNFYGVQFHPERSGKIGEQILKNFINIE